MYTISIANHKGGVGKTAFTDNLAAALTELGYAVLTIDLDPQAALTRNCGIDTNVHPANYPHFGDMLMGESSFRQTVVPINNRRLLRHHIPSHITAFKAGAWIQSLNMRKELVMRKALAGVGADYDYCLIDCPPDLGVFVVNALFASDGVLCPCKSDYMSASALLDFLDTVCEVQESHMISLLGTAMNDHDNRSGHFNAVIDDLGYATPVLDTVVTHTDKIAAAASNGLSLLDYMPRHKCAAQFRQLTQELLNVINSAPA